MRKEVLFAIIAGAVFGIVLAFGIWRANTALEPKVEPETIAESQEEITPVSETPEFDIALAKPNNYDVITENPTLVSGVTDPDTWVAISAEEEDYVIKSDETGKFEHDVDLVGGVNQVAITAFKKDGTKVEENLLVVFSTEFEK